jgi:hypothetical protein
VVEEAGDRERVSKTISALGLALGIGALLSFYLFTGFGLSGDTDLMRSSSGLYDMDVQRVVADLSSGKAGLRASVHPLQKLLLAPIGGALNRAFFAGRDGLAATRILIALAMTLLSLAAGCLAWQLSRRGVAAAASAATLAGVSFASVLAASVPESAVFAGLGTLLPLIALNARWGRPFGWGESFAWGALSALALGLTLTQIIPVWIAVAVRLTLGRPTGTGPESSASARAAKAAVLVAVATLLVGIGVEIQKRTHPGTPAFYNRDPIGGEAPYLRTDEALSSPLGHSARLLAHFAVFDFVAPMPAPSDFLIRGGSDYWSLSVEAATLDDWRAPQLGLAAAVLAAVLAAAWLSLRRDPRMLAPVLCLAAHFALHWFYGREYVLYAPHWHGVLVAVLVAGAWNGLAARRNLVPALAALLATGMIANDVVVLRAAYREAAAGLSVEVRDEHGRLPSER